MRRWLFALMLALCLSSAYAEIPLVLEATIPLPPNSGWDVQHWMSDSTFGWACISGDTAIYCWQIGDSVRRLIIPDSVYSQFMILGTPRGHDDIRLLRLGSVPGHAITMIRSFGEDVYGLGNFYVYSLFDVSADRGEGGFYISGSYIHENGGGVSTVDVTLSESYLCPSPPLGSTVFALARNTTEQWYSYHGEGYEMNSGGVLYEDLLTLPQQPGTGCAGTALSPFMRSNSVSFAVTGSSYFRYYDSQQPEVSNWVTTFTPGSPAGASGNLPAWHSVAAQRDANGTERIVLSGATALDPNSLDTLWNAAVGSPVLAAMLAGHDDERLLVLMPADNYFRVYDASDGSYLDHTSPFVGTFSYLIRRSGYPAEIVTRDEANTVRVYGTLPMTYVPDNLTCRYLPDSNLIRLTWTPVASATQYYVYSSSNPSTVEIWEGTVTAPGHSFDLVPEESKRFYFVTAEYGDGGTIGRARHAVPLRQTHAGRAR